MKNRKSIKWIVATLGLIVFLFATLIVHLALVIKPTKYDNPSIQLSRIDFEGQVDSLNAIKVLSTVRNYNGVKNAYLNYSAGNIVFSHDINKVQANEVIENASFVSSTNIKKFILTENEMAGACPVIHKKSIIYQLSSYVSKHIN